jgi:hypothetical protein
VKLSGAHQFLVSADDADILGGNILVNIIKKKQKL